MIARNPYIVRRQGCYSPQVVIGVGIWAGHQTPDGTVPVLDYSLLLAASLTVAAARVAHGPHVGRGDRRHSGQVVRSRTYAGAGNNRPTSPIPVHRQSALHADAGIV